MTGRLDGRTALVTGAGSPTGIGFATARILAREGVRVAIGSTTDRIHERANELREQGFEVVGFPADLTDPQQARATAEGVVERFGRIDALVNNAGMVQTGTAYQEVARVAFQDVDEATWRRDLALNLDTAFHMSKAVLPHMLERGYGRIVMVSSVTGPFVTNPGDTGYGVAKSAMDGLMRSIAIETARRGVTVNSVAPGWITTGSQTEDERIAGEHTPIGRSGRPEEIGEVIAFLCSEGSSYLTGQSIPVDGGNILQEYKGPPDSYY